VKRRAFLTLLAGAALALPLITHAQQTTRSYRVAYLALLGDKDPAIVKQRLAELGYVEGRNLTFDLHSADGKSERLPQLAADLVKTNPDVIVAGFGTATAQAAQAATSTIPVVFTSVGDALGTGLVKSLSRPGGNLTGIHTQATDIFGKRLQVLDDLVPGIRSIAVLLNADVPFTAVALPGLRIAAEARGQRLELCDASDANQLRLSLEAAARAGATGLTILETPPLLGLRREIVDLAAKLRLFAMYSNRDFVIAGGLASYGSDRTQLYRRAAELVDKVLKGERPADIPVEQPTKFELVLNLRTAKTLGVNVPERILAIADEVIE
jgi:putative tryptophan/tyrosine transport system substrate-binding protein